MSWCVIIDLSWYTIVTYCYKLFSPLFPFLCGVHVFLRCWPPATMWVGPLIFVSATHHQECLNNPIFILNWRLCATCWAYFMCHHGLWPPPVSHPFFFLNNSFRPCWRKILYYQKITIPIIKLQNFALSGCFSFYSVLSYYFHWHHDLLRIRWYKLALFKPLTPRRCNCNLKLIIFALLSNIDKLSLSYGNTPGEYH